MFLKTFRNVPRKSFARNCSGEEFVVNVSLIKQLRKETQAGVMDCRDALVAGNNDLQKAKDWLFDKAKITVAKKMGRKAQEGGVTIFHNESVGVMLELNSETDFVAKEKSFAETSEQIARAIHANYSSIKNKGNPDKAVIADLPLKTTISGFETTDIKDVIQQLTFLYKENIQLKRVALFPQEDGCDLARTHIFSYLHSCISPNLAKIGCVVHLETSKVLNDEEKAVLKKLGGILSTQVLAGKPYSISGKERMDSVDDAELCHEEDFEPSILKQMALMEEGSIGKIIGDYEKKLGCSITLQNMGRWEKNAGEEKEEANLLDDVKSLINENKE